MMATIRYIVCSPDSSPEDILMPFGNLAFCSHVEPGNSIRPMCLRGRVLRILLSGPAWPAGAKGGFAGEPISFGSGAPMKHWITSR